MKRGIVGRKPKLTREQYARVREWVRLRDSIPTVREFARELGVSEGSIASAISGLKHYDGARE